jgi:hypothetical protein
MNDKMNEETVDEGLLDRIVDTIAGKSSKASQHATNLKAFFRGDKDAIGDPEQAENLRKFERNLHRIKEKFDSLIEELGDDLVSAIGIPDEGPFKDVVDEFDTAVNALRAAIDNIAVKADKIDDALPSKKTEPKRFSREDYESKKDNSKDTAKSNTKKQDDEEEFRADDYGFDDDGVFRAQNKQKTATEIKDIPQGSTDSYESEPIELPKLDQLDPIDTNAPNFVRDVDGSWGEYISDDDRTFYWNKDINESSWEYPDSVNPDSGSEHQSYWDEAEQGSMPASLTENTKITLSKWQKIIS